MKKLPEETELKIVNPNPIKTIAIPKLPREMPSGRLWMAI